MDLFDDDVAKPIGVVSFQLGTSLVQSQHEKRSRLMTKHANLIEAAANHIEADFKKVSGTVFLEKPVLTKITADRIGVDSNIITGRVDWTCTVASIMPRRRLKVDISYPIKFGVLKSTVGFKNTKGQTFAFSKDGFREALRLRDENEKMALVRKRTPIQMSSRYEI